VSWDKVLGCVVCRFHVASGEKLHADKFSGAIFWSVAKLAGMNLRKFVYFSYWFDNLGSQLRQDLLLCSSYLTLGVTNYASINKFSGAVAGEKEDFCKGSLSLPIFYFVIVLLYFIFACIILSKIQKN
jgi:hypothetical protein